MKVQRACGLSVFYFAAGDGCPAELLRDKSCLEDVFRRITEY
ncbi:MAG: hypothetical protein WBO58_08100 [Gammaproteobacteria bacterium]